MPDFPRRPRQVEPRAAARTPANPGPDANSAAQARRRQDAGAPAEQKPPNIMGRIIALSKSLSGLILSLGGVVIVSALLFLLGQQLLRRTVSIDPLSVPKNVAERGYTGQIAAAHLRAAILKITEQASIPVLGADVSLHAEAPDIVIPKLGIPLDAIASVARTLFGTKRWRSISGEFVEQDKLLWLTLRINGRDFYTAPQGVNPDRPDEAIEAAALAVLGATSPVIVAAWKARSDGDAGLALAARIIKDLPEKSQDVLWAYILTGAILIDRKQHEIAEKACLEAIRIDPRNAFAYNNLGSALWDQHRPVEAAAEFRRAIKLDPRLALFHNNLGMALRDEHKPGEVMAELRRAIELDPHVAMAHSNLGFVLYEAHKLDEAVSELRRAIELDPKLAMAHTSLGMALRDEHKPDEAMAELRRAIELDPKLAQAHNNLAAALRDEHKLDEAIGELRRAIELDPNLAIAHNNLGLVLYEQHKLDEGVSELRRAIELNRTSLWLIRIWEWRSGTSTSRMRR